MSLSETEKLQRENPLLKHRLELQERENILLKKVKEIERRRYSPKGNKKGNTWQTKNYMKLSIGVSTECVRYWESQEQVIINGKIVRKPKRN